MAVLLVADVNDGALATDQVAKALAALTTLGEVHVLVAGTGGDAAAAEAATLAGVSKVLFADDHAYCHGMAEATAALVVGLAGGYSHICGAATAANKNVLPRVAALLDVMVLSDVTAVIDADTFERPIYAGNAIQTVRAKDTKKIITVRTTAFVATAGGGAAPVEIISTEIANPGVSHFKSEALAQSERPELTAAKTIISGGRGVGSAENFAKVIEPVANRLGAAIGASRAAVDAGFAPNDLQVGQTGKAVAPDLYLAVGISGAIQHLAGMKDSKIIVAINKDEEAPIFQVADYGLVADLFVALPELEKELEKIGR
jgi:electron transfer flavoprotein alpha subunit